MANRPQNRKKNGRRPVYDQARDTRSSRPANRGNVGYPSSTTPGSHPVTNPNYDPDAPRPSRYAAQNTGYSSYPDNSIQFPTGGRSAQNQNRNPNASRNRAQGQNMQSAQRRKTSNQRSNQRQKAPQGQRPRNGQARPQNPNAARTQRPASGQRLRPTQANLRDPARREGKKKRKMTRKALRRRRAIQRLTALAMLLCVIAAGIYLTVTMLFKISTIQVRTADGVVSEAGGYTSEQILQALGVQLEENIFSFDPAAKAAALEKVFPMLEDIKVERDYPSTVVVRVTEAQPAYAMQTSSGWLTLSASLKILAVDPAQPTGLPTLYGGEPVSLDPGEQLSIEEEKPADSADSESASDSASASSTVEEEEGDKRLDSLNTLLTALDTIGMRGDVTRIEFADPEEMSFLYQDRISVLLGTLNELDYKLKLAQHVLLNEDGKGCAATDTGTLDFTHISMSSTRKFTFAQGEPKLPSGYVVPEPAAEDTTADTPAEDDAASAADAAADTPADDAAQPADDTQAATTETDPAPAAQDTAGTGAAN